MLLRSRSEVARVAYHGQWLQTANLHLSDLAITQRIIDCDLLASRSLALRVTQTPHITNIGAAP